MQGNENHAGGLTRLRRRIFGLNLEDSIEQAVNGQTLDNLLKNVHIRKVKEIYQSRRYDIPHLHHAYEDTYEFMIGHPKSRLRWPGNQHEEICEAISSYLNDNPDHSRMVAGCVKSMIIGRIGGLGKQKTRIVPIWRSTPDGVPTNQTFIEQPYFVTTSRGSEGIQENIHIKANHKDIIWNTKSPHSYLELINAMGRVCQNLGPFPRYNTPATRLTYENDQPPPYTPGNAEVNPPLTQQTIHPVPMFSRTENREEPPSYDNHASSSNVMPSPFSGSIVLNGMPYTTFPHLDANNRQMYTSINLDQTMDSLIQAARRTGERLLRGGSGTLNFTTDGVKPRPSGQGYKPPPRVGARLAFFVAQYIV